MANNIDEHLKALIEQTAGAQKETSQKLGEIEISVAKLTVSHNNQLDLQKSMQTTLARTNETLTELVSLRKDQVNATRRLDKLEASISCAYERIRKLEYLKVDFLSKHQHCMVNLEELKSNQNRVLWGSLGTVITTVLGFITAKWLNFL